MMYTDSQNWVNVWFSFILKAITWERLNKIQEVNTKVGVCKVLYDPKNTASKNHLRFGSYEFLKLTTPIDSVLKLLLETSLKICEARFLSHNHFNMVWHVIIGRLRPTLTKHCKKLTNILQKLHKLSWNLGNINLNGDWRF